MLEKLLKEYDEQLESEPTFLFFPPIDDLYHISKTIARYKIFQPVSILSSK